MLQLRRRGRPVDPAKRAALLAAARHLFLAKGFDAVTMGEIAAHAHVYRALQQQLVCILLWHGPGQRNLVPRTRRRQVRYAVRQIK